MNKLSALKVSQAWAIIQAAEARPLAVQRLSPSRPLYRGDFVESEERAVLVALIEELSDEARRELAALMWWGRGHEFGEFSDAIAHARVSHADPDYLAGKVQLGAFLRTGIQKLRNAENLIYPEEDGEGAVA